LGRWPRDEGKVAKAAKDGGDYRRMQGCVTRSDGDTAAPEGQGSGIPAGGGVMYRAKALSSAGDVSPNC
jgi:hypothetical protein